MIAQFGISSSQISHLNLPIQTSMTSISGLLLLILNVLLSELQRLWGLSAVTVYMNLMTLFVITESEEIIREAEDLTQC